MTPVRAIFGAVPGEPAGRVLVYTDGGAPRLGEDVTARLGRSALPGWAYFLEDVIPPREPGKAGRVYLRSERITDGEVGLIQYAPSVIGAAWVTPVLAQ